MTFADFVRLPPAVMAGVVLMLWPAIWAAAQLSVALVGDIIRQAKRPASRAVREAA